MKALDVFTQSEGKVTLDYYRQLGERGVVGQMAVNLFRALKCSTRAKKYRGGGYSQLAYNRKNWSMRQLCLILNDHAGTVTMQVDDDTMVIGIAWGWAIDPAQPMHRHVLYVELPNGQVSFHSDQRFIGPDYPHGWDGQHASQARILAYCDAVWAWTPLITKEKHETSNL